MPFEGLGCIGDWIQEHGHTVTATRWYETPVLPDLQDIDWLIIMGGPMGVYETEQHPWLRIEKQFIADAIQQQKKVLGVCLGAQLIAAALGARVYPNPEKEIGWFPVQFISPGSDTFPATVFPPELNVFHWHGDTFDLPSTATRFAATAACAHQAFIYKGKVVGLQFHLEVRPQDAADMAAAGAQELKPAPYIQDAATITQLSGLATAANAGMHKLLDYMATL